MLILFFLAMETGGVVQAKNLDIFEQIEQYQVGVAADGTAYVLNIKECKVRTFKADGSEGITFSGKGQGPGEIEGSNRLQLVDGLVSVGSGWGQLHLFKMDGTFVTRGFDDWGVRSLSKRGVISSQMPFTRNFSQSEEPSPLEIYGTDRSLGEKKVILTWPRPAPDHRVWATITKDREMTLHFNPAADILFMETNADGSRIYLYPTNAQEILVFDGSTHERMPGIQLPKPPVMNDYWFDIQVEEEKALIKKGTVIPSNFDHFPGLRYMNLIDGVVYVVLWSVSPDKLLPVLAFDAEGTSVTPRYSAQAVMQIAGIWEETAWVVTWDAEEEVPGLVRVPLADIEKTVAANPIKLTQF